MVKTAADRIQSLLNQIDQRAKEVADCVRQLSAWQPNSTLMSLVIGFQNRIRESALLTSSGDVLDIDALWHDVNSIAVLITVVPQNSRVVVDGARRDARLLLEQMLNSIENMLKGVQIGLKRMSIDDIRDAIPKQKVAAYQFAFRGDNLIVANQNSDASNPDHAIAAASLRALIEEGERVVRELARSNCPPRLIEAFAALQAKLKSHDSVVEIGMLNKSCLSLVNACADELASTLLEWVKAHSDGVYDFLAQYPDWRKFVENSLSVKLGRDQVGHLADAARAVAAATASYSNVDEAVPNAFEGIALLADEIKEPDGRIALGLGRTLENIISLAARLLLAIKGDVQSEARKILARGILVAIPASAIAILMLIPGAEWVPNAISQGLKAFGY